MMVWLVLKGIVWILYGDQLVVVVERVEDWTVVS